MLKQMNWHRDAAHGHRVADERLEGSQEQTHVTPEFGVEPHWRAQRRNADAQKIVCGRRRLVRHSNTCSDSLQ